MQCSLGQVTNYINDAIKSLERSLKHLLTEFLNHGVENLSLGKKTDFEPVMKSLQTLTNTIALIAETILNDSSLATDDVYESVTLLTLILTHCLAIVQGTKVTIATIIHSRKKYIPDTINSCLHSMDNLITGFSDSIRLVTDVCVETVRALLTTVVSLTTFLDETLKEVFGLVKGVTLTVGKITEDLSYGVSRITQDLSDILG